MKLFLRILTPVLILIFSYGVVRWMLATPPEAQTRQPPPAFQQVDAITLRKQNYQVIIHSQGTVKPRTESTLKPQVSGKILSISPSFRDGGFFDENEWLLTIDPSDYETAVVVAKANLALKESELEVERAQHEQARENWKLLGDGSEPSPLTLREPQLAEAVADVESARARVNEAERNLERTRIKAPYVGRILQKSVDVGQYVSPGNDLASIFAIDYVEVRLPLRNEHLDFIEIPEEFRDEQVDPAKPTGPKVALHGQYGSRDVSWEGVIIRAEGAYDGRTRELFVVAQINDPYVKKDLDNPPLKVGQFVQAEIFGEELSNVFVIPRSAFRDGHEVLLISEDNKLIRREITSVWKDESHVIVNQSLNEGEILCITPLSFAADGASVSTTIDGVQRGGQGPGQAGGPGPSKKQKSN